MDDNFQKGYEKYQDELKEKNRDVEELSIIFQEIIDISRENEEEEPNGWYFEDKMAYATYKKTYNKIIARKINGKWILKTD